MLNKLLDKVGTALDRERLAIWASSFLVIVYSFVVMVSLMALLSKPLPTSLLELLKIWAAPFSSLAMYALRRLWRPSYKPPPEDEEE